MTPEKLRKRKKYITASDVSAVLGKNPWKKPIDVFYEKTSDEIIEFDNEDTLRGKRAEASILAWHAASFDHHSILVPNSELQICEDFPFLAATPDAYVYDAAIGAKHPFSVVDAKCPRTMKYWEKGAPEYYKIQIWAQMLCANVHYGALVVALENQPDTLKVFHLSMGEFNNYIDWIKKLDRFHKCMQTGVLTLEFW